LPQFVFALVCPVRNGSPQKMEKFCTGWSNNPNFGFLVSFYDTIPPFKAGFWKFHIPKFFGNWCRKFFAKFAKNDQIWAENGKKNFGKTGISKSSLERLLDIITTRYKTKIGVMGPTRAENFFLPVDFQVIFLPFSLINGLKYPKRCPVRHLITRPPVKIFQFCKKFLNPHIPNFKICL